MANCFSSWAKGAGRLVTTWLAALLLVATTLSTAPAKEPGPEDPLIEITKALNAFTVLRRDLGLEPSPVLQVELKHAGEIARDRKYVDIFSSLERVASGPTGSLVAALCRIVAPETLAAGSGAGGLDLSCLKGIKDLDTLQARVLQEQKALLEAANVASKLHEKAYEDFIDGLFTEIVCREGSDICTNDPDATLRWWKETGKRALMVLDWIGREHIKLTERLVEEELANARDHVFARLERVLGRQDVKVAVRVLLQADPGKFGALSEPNASRDAKLKAVAAVSGWIQETIAGKFKEQLAKLPETTNGLRHLKAALLRAEAGPADQPAAGTGVTGAGGADPSRATGGGGAEPGMGTVDAVVAGFMESRQRLVEIVVLGQSLASARSCTLPDSGLLMGPGQEEPQPTVDAIKSAFEGLKDFLAACQETGDSIAALAKSLDAAKPPPTTTLEVAQALCRFGRKLASDRPGRQQNDQSRVEPLRVSFLEDLPDDFRPLVDGSGANLCKIVEGLPVRLDTARQYLETQRDQAKQAGEEAKVGEIEAAETIILAADGSVRQQLTETLDRFDGVLWAAGQLLFGDVLLGREVVGGLGSCTSTAALAVTWRLQEPEFARTEKGLALTFEGDIALCRPMPKRPPAETKEEDLEFEDSKVDPVSAVWPFARAQGRISIGLEGRFPAGPEINSTEIGEAITQLAADVTTEISTSFKLDQAGLERYAHAELARRGKEITEAAIEALLRKNVTDAIRRTISALELRELLAPDAVRASVTDDGGALVLQFPVEVPAIGVALDYCTLVPLKNESTTSPLPSECRGIEDIKAQVWDRLRAELEKRVLEPLWVEAEQLLSPFVERFATLGELLDENGLTVGRDEGVVFRVESDRAVLSFQFPKVLEAIRAVPFQGVSPEHFTGELTLAQGFSDESPKVLARPGVDFVGIARTLYPALGTAPPALIEIAQLPEGDADCATGLGVRMYFGAEAPLDGALGALCWDEGELTYSPPRTGDFGGFVVSVPAGDLRLSIEAGGARVDGTDGERGALLLLARLEPIGAADPWGLSGRRLELRVSIDLESGVVTIPEKTRENERFYAHMRARAASVLPQGARVERIEISSRGIDLKVVGLGDALFDAAFETFFTDKNIAAVTDWMNNRALDEGSCLALRTAAIGQMLRTLEAPDDFNNTAASLCEGHGIALDGRGAPEDSTSTLALPGQEDPALQWSCRLSSGGTLSQCVLQLPKLDAYCGILRVRLTRGPNFAGQGPDVDLQGERECIEQLLRPLTPQGFDDFLPATPVDMRLDCPEGSDLRSCAIAAKVPVSLQGVSAQLDALPRAEGCPVAPGLRFEVGIRIGIDGSLRLDKAVQQQLRAFANSIQDLIRCRLESAAEVEVERFAKNGVEWLDNLRVDLATAITDASEAVGFACHAILSGSIQGRDSVPCAAYREGTPEPELLSAPPRALVFTRAERLFDTPIEIEVTQAVDANGRLADPQLRANCPGCKDPLNRLAGQMASALADGAGPAVSYDRGASIEAADRTLRYQAPFTLSVPELGVKTRFSISCELSVYDQGSFRCDGQAPDPEALLAGLVAKVLKERLQGENIVVPLGPLEGRLTDARAEGTRVLLAGGMAIPGIEPPIDVTITVPLFGHGFHVAFDENTLKDTVGTQLADRLNSLFGGLVPLEIANVGVGLASNGVPEEVRISSTARIEGLFTISIPDVIVGRDGLKIDGPSELAIGFPPGVQIPVPPVSICPTGGTIGSERLVLFASATVVECTADSLLSQKGRAEINLRTPGIFNLRGDMVLLKFLTLGNAESELNLREHHFDSALDIGGPISSVINYRSEMRVEAKPTPRAETRDKLTIFRVPVNEQRVAVDFATGAVNAELGVNLFGVITGSGDFGMETYGRNPRANLQGSAQIAGLTLGSLVIVARPNYAKAGFKVLGIGLTVVVPGLDALSPGYLADIIKKLLTPDFKNLDKAILALLSGNITINPMASFGSGGDGAMDGGGGAEEAGGPGGDTAKSGAEGLGEDEGQGVPAPQDTSAGEKVQAQGSSPTEPAKLNPPGQFRIDLVPAGAGYAVNLMEGKRLDTQIAAVPKHPLTDPIFVDPKAGVPLAFTKRAYAHLGDSLMANEAGIADCPTNAVTRTVFTFSGVEEPQVGYFELCRMLDAGGQSLGQAGLTDPAYADLMRPFLTGLATVPASMPPLLYEGPENLQPGQPMRVLLTGYKGEVDLGAMGRVKMVAGMVTPGRLLIVANMPEGFGTCTTTPTSFGASKIRSLMMDVPDMARPLKESELNKLADALRGLAACKSQYATIAHINGQSYITADGYLGTADGYLGRWDGSRYVTIRKPDPDEERVQTQPDPVILAIDEVLDDEGPPEGESVPPPSEEELRKLIEQAPPAGQPADAIPIANGGGSGRSLVLTEEGAACLARWSDGERITGYTPGDLEWPGCAPADRKKLLVVGVASAEPGSPDSGRLLLIENWRDPNQAKLVHLGWGKGQGIPLGQWRTEPGFAAIDAAIDAFGQDVALTLVGVAGFEILAERAVPGPAGILFSGADGHPRLAWGANSSRGGLVLPEGVDGNRAKALPAMLTALTADERLPHPNILAQAEPLADDPDRLLLHPRWGHHDSPLPIIDWSDTDSRWLLAARLVEKPAPAESTRKAAIALLDDRLNARDPASPALDTWVFRLSSNQIGVALAGGDEVDEVRWQEREWVLPETPTYEAPQDLVEYLANERDDQHVFEALCEIAYDAENRLVHGILGLNRDRPVSSGTHGGQPTQAEYLAALMVLYERADQRIDCGVHRWHSPGQPEVGSPDFFAAVRDVYGIEIIAGNSSAEPPKFGGYEKRIAGFYELNAPDECHAVARALLALAKDDKLAGKRVVRGGGSCAPGQVLLIAGPESGVKELAVLQGSAFNPEARIDGDALPIGMVDQFREAFGTNGRAEELEVKGFLLALEGREPAWAAQDDDGVLRILLTKAGDPKTLVVEGLEGKSDRLRDLIRFAITSQGKVFRVRRTSAGAPVVGVTTAAGDKWLVSLEENFAPRAWVTLDLEGAEAPEGPALDALALMLEAALGRDRETFTYEPDGTPARWRIAAGPGTLAVRPVAESPYLLFIRDAETEPFSVAALCAPQLSSQMLLDIARRTRADFARTVADPAELGNLLKILSRADCDKNHPGVARFTPTELGASTGLVSGTDLDRRLIIAPYSLCADPNACPFEATWTGPEVPTGLANGLLATLLSVVVQPNDSAGRLTLLHDNALENGHVAGERTLLFTWREHGDGSTGPQDKLLYGYMREMPGEAPYLCMPGPMVVEVDRAGPVTLSDIAGDERDAVVNQLLAYLRARRDELSPIATDPDGSRCIDLARLRPLVLLIGSDATIFEEHDASLAPDPTDPFDAVRRPAAPGAPMPGVRVAGLGWVNVVANVGWANLAASAGSTGGRTRAKQYLPNATGAHASVTYPAELNKSERLRLLRALAAIMPLANIDSVDFEEPDPAKPQLLCGLFDGGTSLVIDVAEANAKVVRLQHSCVETPEDRIFGNVAEGWGGTPGETKLPIPLSLLKGVRDWLVVETAGEQRVWALGSGPQMALGKLEEGMTNFDRVAILERVRRDLDPFCALRVAHAGGPLGIWYRMRGATEPCNAANDERELRRWSVRAPGGWVPVETALSPETVPIDTVLRFFSSFDVPPNDVVQVTGHTGGPFVLALMTTDCRPSAQTDGIETAELWALRLVSGGAGGLSEDIALVDQKSKCLFRRDLAPVLAELSRNPDHRLELIASGVSRGIYDGMAVPVLELAEPSARLLGFSGRPTDLVVTSPPGGQMPAECGPGPLAPPAYLGWEAAVRAFASAFAEGQPAGQPGAAAPPRGGALRFLMIEPDSDRGWLITGDGALVEIGYQAGRTSGELAFSVPDRVFSSLCVRALVTRLLVGLREQLDVPAAGGGWPATVLEDGDQRFIAGLSQEAVFLVADATLVDVLQLNAHGFQDSAQAIGQEGVLRQILRVALQSFAESTLRAMDVLQFPNAARITAVAGPTIDGPISHLGYLEQARFERIRIETPNQVPWRRGTTIAEAIAAPKDGMPAAWRDASLMGGGATLRLCPANGVMVRLIASPTAGAGMPMVDANLWKAGARAECAILTGAEAETLIETLRPDMLPPSVALVLAETRSKGLLALGSGPHHSLHRGGGADTGCTSRLEGVGAAGMAKALFDDDNLLCRYSEEFPDNGPTARAAIFSMAEAILLIREGCTLKLAPHPGTTPDISRAKETIRAYANALGAEDLCAGDGRWFELQGERFARVSDTFLRLGTGPRHVLTSPRPEHDLWFSRWLLSPGVEVSGPLGFSGREAAGGALEITLGLGADRVYLTDSKCLGWRDSGAGASALLGQALSRTGAGPDPAAYRCETAIVALSVDGLSYPVLVEGMLLEDRFLECFAAFTGAPQFPSACMTGLVYLGPGFAKRLRDTPPGRREHLWRLLQDLLAPAPSSTRQWAGEFVRAMDPDWDIVSTGWSPDYAFILRNAVRARYRFNSLEGRCLEMTESEIDEAVSKRAFEDKNCPDPSRAACALIVLKSQLARGGSTGNGPIWYRGRFNGDPRNIIWSNASDCLPTN